MSELIPNVAGITTNVPLANAKTPSGKPEPLKKSPPTTSNVTFGLLKEVPVNEIWNDEHLNFADWFSENVEMLGAVLGMKFADVQKIGKGDFTATDGGRQTVIIETQFQQTSNHNLGRILAHSAEYNANVAVWVVAFARSEHKATVRWMNTNGKIPLYLVELHSYKVGDSMVAANFEVVERL